MRVRILKAITGIIDGVPLSQFIPGEVYQVSEGIATQLVEMNSAVVVRSIDPVLATPRTSSDDVDVERVAGGIHVTPPDTADDRKERRHWKRL